MKTNLQEIIAYFKCSIHKINGHLVLKERISKKQLRVWVDDLLGDLERAECFEAEQREFLEVAKKFLELKNLSDRETGYHLGYIQSKKEVLGEA